MQTFTQPHRLHIHDQIHTPAFLQGEQNLYFAHPNLDINLPLNNLV